MHCHNTFGASGATTPFCKWWIGEAANGIVIILGLDGTNVLLAATNGLSRSHLRGTLPQQEKPCLEHHTRRNPPWVSCWLLIREKSQTADGREKSLQDTHEKSTCNLALELQGSDNWRFLCPLNSGWKTKRAKSLDKSQAEGVKGAESLRSSGPSQSLAVLRIPGSTVRSPSRTN